MAALLVRERHLTAVLWATTALYAFGRLCQLWADRWPTLLIVFLHVAPPVIFAAVHGTVLYRLRGMLAFTFCCLGTGAVCESLSLWTGFPFGHYAFTGVMGPKLLGLPVLLVFAYLGIGYVSLVLSLLVLRQQSRPLVGAWRWRVPLLASGIMLAWDLSMEADWATVDRAWLWRDGGIFFGVPISNFLGWFLTAVLYYTAFTRYLAKTQTVSSSAVPSSVWQSAIAMYAICALGNLLLFAKPMAPATVVDLSGRPWQTETILAVGALVSVFVMGSVAFVAWMRLRTIPLVVNEN